MTSEQDNGIPDGSAIVLYRTADGRTRIECRFADGSIWLTQALIAELYQTSIPNVNIHLKNIYASASWPRRQLLRIT